jgi:branched-chain amino acid transport system permease protein
MIAALGLLMFLKAVVQAVRGAGSHRLSARYTQIIRFFDLVAPAQRLIIVATPMTFQQVRA